MVSIFVHVFFASKKNMAITVSSLKLTAKMDGWKTIRLPFWDWQFPVVFAVSFSEVYLINQPFH